MPRIEVTTKPNGAGRNWLEVGTFEIDSLGRKQWVKKNVPHQESRLTVDRQYSERGETIDWIVLIPDNYPYALAKITYDRLKPKNLEILWEPGSSTDAGNTRENKKKRAYELAAGNEELLSLLNELLKD
ncbi:MAG: hypothetical protein OXD54_05055 [Candidatus Poribacteria bacterium]|nr:hypothetical protein [Candidatus Poribacteria bacterium]